MFHVKGLFTVQQIVAIAEFAPIYFSLELFEILY